jgi:hypothetical protein
MLMLAARPAEAIITKIGSQGYGVTPIGGVNPASLSGAYRALGASGVSGTPSARNQDELPLGGTPLVSHGGPVMHSTTTHVIYWDPHKEFKPTTTEIISGFFTNVAHDSGLATNVFAIAGQYTDTTGHAAYSSTFGGALVDEEEYPTSENCITPNEPGRDKGPYATCLFDAQLKTELAAFVNAHSLPRGPTQLYFLLLPHSVATCLPEVEGKPQACSNNVFCAYHSYISPGTASEIIYADIPFSLLDTGFAKECQDDGHTANLQQPNPDFEGGEDTETRFADVALKYISHEAIEAITDPLVNVTNQTAWVDAHGLEIGDKCNGVAPDLAEDGIGYDNNAFLPVLGGEVASNNLSDQSINSGSYYLQSEWDNAERACLMQPAPLSEAGFTPASAQATAGQPVSFSGTAFDPYGELELNWAFGDGATGTGPTPGHVFAAAGVYTVTMTPKDSLTNSTTTPVSHTVTVSNAPSSTSGAAAAASVAPAAPLTPVVVPDSSFPKARAALNANTGAITFTTSVLDPGTLSWLLTFQNGKFGAFASSNPKCKPGLVRLSRKCRPAKIVFAKGSKVVVVPGAVSFTLRPSGSALKALKNALRQKKGLPVTMTLTFRSSLGGGPASRTQSLTVQLRAR